MEDEAMSAHRIRGVIPFGEAYSEAIREIGGHRYKVKVWTRDQWERMAPCSRPGTAQPLGMLGWIDIQPCDPS
jgi:hypothetical protein